MGLEGHLPLASHPSVFTNRRGGSSSKPVGKIEPCPNLSGVGGLKRIDSSD